MKITLNALRRPSRRPVATERGHRRGFGTMIGVLIATLAAGAFLTAEAQTKDDFAYWDANGNGDLTCTEARGRDEGLRLPAYRDNRNGTGVIYEWLERGTSSDSDNDGIACESASNPNGYVPSAGSTPPPTTSARECPAGSPTWMGLPVCEEGARAGYDRDAFGSAYSSLEDEIIDGLPKSGGQVYTPYICKLFDIRADGTAATDIEHVVALAEAYDSGLAELQFRAFAGDLDNLTIADPVVNRIQKSDRDAGEWSPPQNRGWFAARVVAVKQKYGLAVNPAERDALQAMLNSDLSRTVTCGEPAAEAAALDFTHFANGGNIVSSLVLVNAGADPVRPAIYFHDQDGGAIAAESMLDVPADMEIGDDGALRPGTAMNPLGELTISTHGRGVLKVGSVTVTAEGPVGGVLRFDIPGFGVAGVGDSPTLRDALVPVRRQDGGINTGVAVRNRGEAALLVRCRLMRDGAVLEETIIPLAANGQDSRFIEQVFPTTDTSDFVGSVRCLTSEPGLFSAVAFELDGVHRIFTTLPVVPVPAVPEPEQEPEPARLDFTHFANGGNIVSSLVLVNPGADAVRPAIYFYDQQGDPIAAESMLDVPADMEIGNDGALSPRTAMNPLGELTISTHGRGVLKVGSVTVAAAGPVGGVLRFDIPGHGVAGVGDSPPVRDALVPVRRQDGGINTGVAVHNRGTTALLVRCRLMRDGAVLEETMIPLAANGQDSRFIEQVFPTADTSDFVGSVRCLTSEPGLFSAVAFELDGVHRIFTTLPVVPVVEVP